MRADDIRKEILMQAYAVRPLAVTAERLYREEGLLRFQPV
jgi:hypothetical protein